MCENLTSVYLLGFSNTHNFKVPLFMALLIIYVLTIIENVFIIVLFFISKVLHSPMYFFLTQVSLCDILLTTSILPNVLRLILHEGGRMSSHNCFVQFFFFAMSEGSESFLLTVMCYDRYVAICLPLRYNTIMDERFCLVSSLVSWLLAIVMILIEAIFVSQLQFCGPVVLDHFFCDPEPLLMLSCSDTFIASLSIVSFGFVALVFPFIIIIISYVYIIWSVYAIPSKMGGLKAFSTCGSHLTVVSIFYGTLMSVYVVPNNGNVLVIKKILAVFYTMVIPFLNPIIYSLRNKDIKGSLYIITRYLNRNVM